MDTTKINNVIVAISGFLFHNPYMEPSTVLPVYNPSDIILKTDTDMGEGNYLKYIVDFYRLSPPLKDSVCVKLYIKGHIRAMMWGYQINKALGN